MSDKTLHALATDMPTTLSSFGNTFGIGEHKRDTYGERFIAVIKQFAPAKIELPAKDETITTVLIEGPKEEKREVSNTTESSVVGTKKKPKNRIMIQGKTFDVDLEIWDSIEWRKVLKEITEKAYWNYKGNLVIPAIF